MRTGIFARCRVRTACAGADKCIEGAHDIFLGCYPCAKGWTRFAGALRSEATCSKCPDTFTSLLTAGLIILGTALFCILVTKINITAARHVACLHPFMLKIALSHLQMMSAFGRYEQWELEFGFGETAPVLHKMLSIVFAWNGNMPGNLIPLECMLDEFQMELKTRLWLSLALWSVLPLLFVVFCLLLGCITKFSVELLSGDCCCCWGAGLKKMGSRHTMMSPVMPSNSSTSIGTTESEVPRASGSNPYEARALGIWRKTTFRKSFRRQAADFVDDSTGLMLAALIVTYPTVLQQTMAFIRCDTLSGNFKESRMLAAPSFICGEGDHVELAIAAWTIMVFWGLGLPVFCFSMLWQERNRLNEFQTRIRLGLLGAEYEPRFFYWDSFVLLRRFAATAAMLCAPAASRAMQLSILLALGLVSLFVHSYYMPFDNRSGELLDVLELQALKLFCATCAMMLLGFSEVTHYVICFILVFAVLLVHVGYMVRMVLFCLIQVRRSVSDAVIDQQMLGTGGNLESRGGPIKWLIQRVFLVEMDSQTHRAHVSFQPGRMNVELEPGSAGDDVNDFERVFVAQGLAEVIARAITDGKLERLSVTFLDFACRVAFARKIDRLQCKQSVQSRIHAKFRLKQLPNGMHPKVPDGVSRKSWKSHIQNSGLRQGLFDDATYSHSMLASDFQSEMIDLALFSRAEFDAAFKAYKMEKGEHVDENLSTRDRLLDSVMGAKKRTAHVRTRTASTLLGAVKTIKNMQALSALPRMEEELEEEPLQVLDLDDPGTASASDGAMLAIEQGEPQQDVTLDIRTATEAQQSESEYVLPNRMLCLAEQLPGSVEEPEAPAAAEAAVSPMLQTAEVKTSLGPTETEETYGRVVDAAELPVYVSALPDSVQVFGDEPDAQSTPMESKANIEAITLPASVHESEELCQTEPISPPMPGAVVEPEVLGQGKVGESLSIEATASPASGEEVSRQVPGEATARPASGDIPVSPGTEPQSRATRRSESTKSGKAKKAKNIAAA